MAKNIKALEKELAELEAKQKADAQRKKELLQSLQERKKEEAEKRHKEFGKKFEEVCSKEGIEIEVNDETAITCARLFLAKYPSGVITPSPITPDDTSRM